MLEDLLADAKSGEIISMAAAVVYADRKTGSFASANECMAAQIGGVAILMHELTTNATVNGQIIAGHPEHPEEPA